MAAAAQLNQDEWERLVCAMYTGARVSDRNLGEIRGVLDKYGLPGASMYLMYLPKVTALYQKNNQGVVERVLDSNTCCTHPEQEFIRMPPEYLRLVHRIGISYSPCTLEGFGCAYAIVERYSHEEEALPKPVIHFSRVYNYKAKNRRDGITGVKHLIANGFDLQVWETERMYEYLRQQAPNDGLGEELRQAYENTAGALTARDEETQGQIDEARR